jgi:hypothetical protein
MYSPHAQLQFPKAAPEAVPCAQVTCTSPSTGGHGSLTDLSPGVPIRHPRSASGQHKQRPDARPARTAASGFTFTFTVFRQQHGTFTATIAVTGKRPGAHWQLAFQMPTDKITRVMGADWLASTDGSGGIASAQTGTSAPWWNGPDGHGGYQDRQQGLVFMIAGTGSPVVPSGCLYDGASCTFTTGGPPQGHHGP